MAEPEATGLAARLRKLSREYGWSALGVYFLLSAIDFPFCYLLVKYLGTDRIGELVMLSLVVWLGAVEVESWLSKDKLPVHTKGEASE